MQVETQQAQKPEAGSERDATLDGLEDGDGPQCPPRRDGV
jgi:hypothetical protein